MSQSSMRIPIVLTAKKLADSAQAGLSQSSMRIPIVLTLAVQ